MSPQAFKRRKTDRGGFSVPVVGSTTFPKPRFQESPPTMKQSNAPKGSFFRKIRGSKFKPDSSVRKRLQREKSRKEKERFQTAFDATFKRSSSTSFRTRFDCKTLPNFSTPHTKPTVFPGQSLVSPVDGPIPIIPSSTAKGSQRSGIRSSESEQPLLPATASNGRQMEATERVRAKMPTTALDGSNTTTTATSTQFVERRTVHEICPPQRPSMPGDHDDDADVANHLCLVPIHYQFDSSPGNSPDKPSVQFDSSPGNSPEEPSETVCYWPCLVFATLQDAMSVHNRLYPQQDEVKRRLIKKHLKHEAKSITTVSKQIVVILPLGNREGCCPRDMCRRPLFNVINTSTTGDGGYGYWTTQIYKRKGSCIIPGQRVIRIMKDMDLIGTYLKKCRSQISIVESLGTALEEMERLMYIDEEADSNCSDDEDKGGSNKENQDDHPFVSSLQHIDQPHTVNEIIRLPRRNEVIELPDTPFATNSGRRITFPRSSPKKRKFHEPSMSPNEKLVSKADVSKMSNNRFKRKANSDADQTIATTVSPKRLTRSVAIAEVAKKPSTKSSKKVRVGRRAKKNPLAVVDSKAKISVSSWSQVKILLRRLGHTFYDQVLKDGLIVKYFCRPNGDPRDHSGAVEGEDYFTSLTAYRAHLCARGIEYTVEAADSSTTTPSPPLGEDGLEAIAYWVRFHVYSVPCCLASKPEKIRDLELSGNERRSYMKVLRRIGYKHKYSMLQEGYGIPDDKGAKGTERLFSEEELFEHLGKHGLSPSCDIDKFESPEERLALEIEIIRNYHGNYGDKAFRFVKKLDPVSDFDNQDNHEFTPSASKDALEECNRAPDFNDEQDVRETMSPRKLLTEDSESVSQSKLETNAKMTSLKLLTNDDESESHPEFETKAGANAGAGISHQELLTEDTESETQSELKTNANAKMPPRNQLNKGTDSESEPELEKNANANHMSPKKMDIESEYKVESETNTDPRMGSSIPLRPTPPNDQISSTANSSAPLQQTNAINKTDATFGEMQFSPSKTLPPTDQRHPTILDHQDPQASASQSTRARNVTDSRSSLKPSPQTTTTNVEINGTTIQEVDLPGLTNDDMLSACLVNLRKNEIVSHGQLSNSIARIRNFVDAVIESKGRRADDSNSPVLYICGNPGTGKTMSATKICQDAIAAKLETKEEWEKAPGFHHISCPSFQKFKYQEGMKKFFERIERKPAQLKRSSNDDHNSATILILDEVDQLLGNKGTEAILKQLSSWAQDPNYMLSIIGISNAVFNNKTNRLKEYGMGGKANKVVFETYKKDDLVKMSQSKIGFTVVDKKAHEFMAAKIANSSGDARQYLDIVEKAILFSRRKLSLEKRDSEHTKPIVTIRDAMLAIRETNQKSRDIILALTSFEKMTLCAGVHLARKFGGTTVPLSKLRELTMHAIGMDSDVSLEEFKGVIERLQDSGLLRLNETERQGFTKTTMHGLLRYPVQFDLQLEDVDSALENTLMKEDFYKRMVDRLESVRI